ncbi:MAG: LysM peptidoglycan-binding domain-containing protein [Marinobacter sp.]
MSPNRLSICLFSAALIAGCASERPLSSADNPLDSTHVAVASGDDDLKEAVLKGHVDTSQDDPLDDAIAPELKVQARTARGRLNTANIERPATLADNALKTGIETENDDLWKRLRDGFALDHDVDQPRLEQQLAWFASHPRYIERVMERGSRYFHYIVSETERRGLPTELALLPIVESAFDPFAYSHGRAAGLWQFIPTTGKYFGLTQSWWHDDRRDVIAATDAALTYLERLSIRFDGDYTLALAAYNSGGGTVSSAIRRNTNADKPTDFWSLKLPKETRHYVPKLLALAKIFADPQAYGIELPALANEPYFVVVETGSQLDLAKAAELAATDIDEMYLLNPSFNRWATNPDGPHRLLVPVANAERFRKALKIYPINQRVSWRNYKVRSGDSLSTIAQRFETTTPVIRNLNKLKGDTIRVGQRLMIPSATGDIETYALSAAQRLEKKQSRPRDGNKVSYKVRPGDTFWDIAREHRVKVRELAAWNSMAPGDPLIPGKKLVIWSQNAQTTVASSDSSASARIKALVRKVGYRVRKGDSLAVIAGRFSVNISDIAGWNDLNTEHYLQPGQSLVLYVDIRNSP